MRATPLDPASSTPSARPTSPQEPGGPEGGESAEPKGFLGATLGELSKVVWPSRQQLFSETVGVIVMAGISAAAIAAIDKFYHWLSQLVFR